MSTTEVECPICMDVIVGNKNVVTTECGHTYHCNCLLSNIQHNGFCCPMCRDQMIEEMSISDVNESSIFGGSDDDALSEYDVEIYNDTSLSFLTDFYNQLSSEFPEHYDATTVVLEEDEEEEDEESNDEDEESNDEDEESNDEDDGDDNTTVVEEFVNTDELYRYSAEFAMNFVRAQELLPGHAETNIKISDIIAEMQLRRVSYTELASVFVMMHETNEYANYDTPQCLRVNGIFRTIINSLHQRQLAATAPW